MSARVIFILSTLVLCSIAQRSPYAGRNPIGYPQLDPTTTTTTADGLGNRFGEDDVSTTTERLPLEANGDRELVNRLKKLPLDKQPFWLINWLALEEQRKNPQTYQPKPNTFIDVIPPPRQNFPNRQSGSFSSLLPQ
ncbi:uncharacterized protein LOC128675468 [Plodia interpunctella]|uniref:uncharacterized protein LOC128675468 n=1 Tax=Plodia interpunctella TaxID=58824 RepID=UPI002368443F|nr:uncharacterized protein LOC128675468 [Plodia interpunctella]XP_053610871.1 uncharacterized protein LOC128675468 [Plodia interpunctella]